MVSKSAKSRKQTEKYEAILAAAAKVIARHGYHRAQVSKIARESNVADGTIYLYFRNKEDILISLFNEKLGRFVETLEREIEKQEGVESKLSALITMYFDYLSHDPDLAMVTQLELRQLELRQINPVVSDQIEQLLKRILRLIDDVIQCGMDEQLFSADLDPLLARYMIFGTLDETVTSWLLKKKKFDLLSKVDAVQKLLLNGLRAN